MDQKKEQKIRQQNEQAKAQEYEEYIKPFAPKPRYFSNALKAFIVGGGICVAAYSVQGMIIAGGTSKEDAGTYATLLLVVLTQVLTGAGVFDVIAKFAGAGVIVPITGFANSMVAPAMEFKKEGIVLGAGSKLFSIAGPVILYGVVASVVIGLIYWVFGL